ncbi:hypothetical protein CPB86DRAFT_44590 [Serendipita vermifera]|nr:hypothetical protein CPB86DRAFT_44590 [Serendipita vermifera]
MKSDILIRFFENRSQDNKQTFPFLESVAISDCQGITRADCEQLRTLVPRVIVYS